MVGKEGLHTAFSKRHGLRLVRKMQVETGFCTDGCLSYGFLGVEKGFCPPVGLILTGWAAGQWGQ